MQALLKQSNPILNNVNMTPVKAEPVKAQLVKAEPVKAEPVKAEPVQTEPTKRELSPVPMEVDESAVSAVTPVVTPEVRVIHPPTTRVINICQEPAAGARTVINIVNGQTQVVNLDGSPAKEEQTLSLTIDSSTDLDKLSATDLEKVSARIARLVNAHSNSCSPIPSPVPTETVEAPTAVVDQNPAAVEVVDTAPEPAVVVDKTPAPVAVVTKTPAPTKTKRNYRKREPSPTKEENNLFDKLPTYFTTLTKTQKPEKSRVESHRVVSEVRGYDRDPSPERDVGFSKLPSYLCFTNSTKYDQEEAPARSRQQPCTRQEALAARAEAVSLAARAEAVSSPVLEERLSGTPYTSSARSSRSGTPNLVIASRPNSESRHTSRAPSRSSRSSSRSSSCGSSSRQGSRSPSPVRQRSRGRSAVRRQPFRRKRHSYSSSHSSSA